MSVPDARSSASASFTRTGVVDIKRRAVPSDLLTVASIAVIVYAVANVLHEGLGHGGACVLAGGAPRLLTSVSFECDMTGVGPSGSKLVAAGGTIVNVLAGSIGALLYRRAEARSPAARFGLWLFAAVNLMQAAGYFLFSGVGRIGDWAEVMADVTPAWAWRVALAVVGFVLYWMVTVRAFGALARFIGGEPRDRYPIGNRLSLTSYAAGALLYCLSGMLNPGGLVLLAVSAAAASLGGTSGLAWGPQLLRGERGEREQVQGEASPVRIARDMRLVAAALVVFLVFVGLLGPGVRLG